MPTLLSLSPWNNGPASIACAALAFSVSTALVRPISREISVFELVFVRSLLSILLSVAIAASQQQPHQQPHQQRDHLALLGSPENRTLLMTRGLSGGLAMTVYYLSIQRLLLAEAMSLLFLNPAIVALLGYAVLGERLNWRQVGGIFTSLAGMLFVVRPPVDEPWSVDRASGVAFGVMSAFLASTAYVSIRKIGKKEDALTIAAYFHSISLATSIVGMGLFAPPVVPGLVDTVYMVSIASCSFLAQLLISRGFQLTSVAVGSAVNYVQVVFGAVFGGC
jgi:drug/metabolite transporter (DMT)-like permease